MEYVPTEYNVSLNEEPAVEVKRKRGVSPAALAPEVKKSKSKKPATKKAQPKTVKKKK